MTTFSRSIYTPASAVPVKCGSSATLTSTSSLGLFGSGWKGFSFVFNSFGQLGGILSEGVCERACQL